MLIINFFPMLEERNSDIVVGLVSVNQIVRKPHPNQMQYIDYFKINTVLFYVIKRNFL